MLGWRGNLILQLNIRNIALHKTKKKKNSHVYVYNHVDIYC